MTYLTSSASPSLRTVQHEPPSCSGSKSQLVMERSSVQWFNVQRELYQHEPDVITCQFSAVSTIRLMNSHTVEYIYFQNVFRWQTIRSNISTYSETIKNRKHFDFYYILDNSSVRNKIFNFKGQNSSIISQWVNNVVFFSKRHVPKLPNFQFYT